MTVQIDITRKAVNISWDTDLVNGDEAEVRATNPNNLEDVSSRVAKNDGYAVLTYPSDYHGESEVVVTGSEGGSDQGIIEV
jgi:hypothetical protein